MGRRTLGRQSGLLGVAARMHGGGAPPSRRVPGVVHNSVIKMAHAEGEVKTAWTGVRFPYRDFLLYSATRAFARLHGLREFGCAL